ncbi:MAG: HEAT repeat domain-containing protein [Deltaproteobacteria bacterium]|nr:HEAT repeat domain-containing protein [Deltaproteobacteria bacterium]
MRSFCLPTAATLVMGVCALDASAADPRPREAQRAAVLSVLHAPHPNVDAAKLARIGPDVQAILVETATGKSGPAAVRMRALGWLQYYPNATSRAVLVGAIAHPESPEALRVALAALANGFGAEALPHLQAHLHHRDALVREAAAHALGHLDDRRVRPLLEAQLEREPSLTVRDAMVSALQRIATRERSR